EAITGAGTTAATNNAAAAAAPTEVTTTGQTAAAAGGATTTTTAATVGSTGGRSAASAPGVQAPPAGALKADPLAAADCDRATGRIKFPSKWAYPCVPDFPKGTDNGGATYIGVSKDTIK